MNLGDQTINEFLSSLSAKQPTPGGGAVAGLLAALSSSLGQMVLSYTEGKKKYEKFEEENNISIALFKTSAQHAISLGNKDALVYSALNELWKLDKDDPKRIAEWDRALADAIEVPLRVLELCDVVANTMQNLVGKTNTMLSSDLVIAGILAEAGARCALQNVEINVNLLEDEKKKKEYQTRANMHVSCCVRSCSFIESSCKI